MRGRRRLVVDSVAFLMGLDGAGTGSDEADRYVVNFTFARSARREGDLAGRAAARCDQVLLLADSLRILIWSESDRLGQSDSRSGSEDRCLRGDAGEIGWCWRRRQGIAPNIGQSCATTQNECK